MDVSQHSAIAVASGFGRMLTSAEIDALIARRDDIGRPWPVTSGSPTTAPAGAPAPAAVGLLAVGLTAVALLARRRVR